MNKIFILLSLLLVSAFSLTDKQILQQQLNGIFEENKLPDPTTIIVCVDDTTAKKTVDFIGAVLDKAAKGSVSDLLAVIEMVKKFLDDLPQPVKDCLESNAELKTLGLKYGIDDSTDPSVIEKKVIAYITLHYLTVHKWAIQLNDEWKAAKYYQNGFDAATYAHSVLGSSNIVSLPELTNKEILQQTLNGLFEANKLPDPVTIVPCIDEATAKKIVDFIGAVLEKAGKGSVSDLISLIDMIKKFGDEIPQPVKDCLDGNAQFKALGLKYGIDDSTDTSALEKKVIVYVTLHYLTVHKWFGDLNTEWKGGKYYQVGADGAGYAHKILNLTPEEIRKLIALA